MVDEEPKTPRKERPDDGSVEEEQRVTEKKPWHRMSRDEVMERLDGYQTRRRADRRRLTGDDVKEMLRERRVRRHQRAHERKARRDAVRRTPHDVGRTVRLGVGWALLAGVVGTAAFASSSTDAIQARAQSNGRTITLLEGEIRALEADTWDESEAADLEERMAQALEESREKGERVAQA